MPRLLQLIAAVALAAAPAVADPAPAMAAWPAPATGAATAAAVTLPAPAAPAVTIAGRSATVTLTQVSVGGMRLGTLTGGGYVVARVSAGGSYSLAGGGCAGLLRGASATITCTETGVPSGSWRYAAAPVLSGWYNASPGMTNLLTVGSPTLTLAPGGAASLPATLTGAVANFVDGASLTFRLDSPTGTVLAGHVCPAATPSCSAATPRAVPAGGSAAVRVTLPSGVAAGEHTIYAVAGDDQAAFAVTVGAPRATSLAIANGGGTAGRPDTGDTVTIGFSQRLRAASICSTWSDDDANQSLSGATVRIRRYSSTSTRLSIAAPAGACGGNLDLGTVTDLDRDYLPAGSSPADAVFTANVAWSPSTRRITVTLGARTSGTVQTVSWSSAGFAPDGAIRDVGGLAIATSSTPTTSGRLF